MERNRVIGYCGTLVTPSWLPLGPGLRLLAKRMGLHRQITQQFGYRCAYTEWLVRGPRLRVLEFLDEIKWVCTGSSFRQRNTRPEDQSSESEEETSTTSMKYEEDDE